MKSSRGFTLIEILVSLLILAIGLLGLAGLQSRAQQAEMESYQRAQALLLLDDMVQRLNSDRSNIRDNLRLAADDCYGGALVGIGGNVPAGCGAVHLQAWHNLLLGSSETDGVNNTGSMLGARGCIVAAAPPGGEGIVRFQVSVAWQGLIMTAAPANNACGFEAYGNESLRRVVSADVLIANLN